MLISSKKGRTVEQIWNIIVERNLLCSRTGNIPIRKVTTLLPKWEDLIRQTITLKNHPIMMCKLQRITTLPRLSSQILALSKNTKKHPKIFNSVWQSTDRNNGINRIMITRRLNITIGFKSRIWCRVEYKTQTSMHTLTYNEFTYQCY